MQRPQRRPASPSPERLPRPTQPKAERSQSQGEMRQHVEVKSPPQNEVRLQSLAEARYQRKTRLSGHESPGPSTPIRPDAETSQHPAAAPQPEVRIPIISVDLGGYASSIRVGTPTVPPPSGHCLPSWATTDAGLSPFHKKLAHFAAEKIQRAWRRWWLCNCSCFGPQGLRALRASIVYVQRWWRDILFRRLMRRQVAKVWRGIFLRAQLLRSSANRLQRGWRMHLTIRWRLRLRQAAEEIQRAWRRHMVCVRQRQKRTALQQLRSFTARKNAASFVLRAMKRFCQVQREAAICLQSQWRGLQIRRRFAGDRDQLLRARDRREIIRRKVAVAAMAAVGCTAFVAAPSTARGPALRSTAQGQASKVSASSGGLAVCGLGAAVAAVIAAPKKQRSALRAFETELGVQPPAGFWDPLGFTKGGDAASFRRRRYVELKHGRVAMLACMGYIVPEYYRWPGELSPSLGLKFTDVPTGFAAFSKVPLSGWAQMVAFAGSVELFQYVDDPKRAPGDFENAGLLGIPNGFMKAPEGQKEKKLAAEIANGRLAMMAIIGMFFQNGLTGQAWGDWSLYTDSPLRALTPAQEIIAGTGGPLPDNFWDPAGITNGKTEKEIAMLRAMELKHGRVAMLAVLHWFHVAAGYHLLGDYAIGERMSNDPLVSLTQLPMGGMWQVIFTIMCLEWLTTYICKPPEDRPWDVLGWKGIIDEDYPSEIWNGWKRVQCQELNNSRLAMVAITGLVAQDVVTGDYVAGVGKLCGGAEVCNQPIDYSPWQNLPPIEDFVANAPSWANGPALYGAQLLEGKASKAPTHPSLPPRISGPGIVESGTSEKPTSNTSAATPRDGRMQSRSKRLSLGSKEPPAAGAPRTHSAQAPAGSISMAKFLASQNALSSSFRSAATVDVPVILRSLLSRGLLSSRPHSSPFSAELGRSSDLEAIHNWLASAMPSLRIRCVLRVECSGAAAAAYSSVSSTLGPERLLWHGTSWDCVGNIAQNGFNRGYSGRHGSKLGRGSYFAEEPAFALRFCGRREPKAIFLAGVLAGRICRGAEGLVEPPADTQGSRYDSTVDDPINPKVFCVFRDFQAIPLYLAEISAA
ncbi:FCPF [Symbiodinium sp. CCMP2592]|nr:FCPF [Symbiodinium sp. CCMP2592]